MTTAHTESSATDLTPHGRPAFEELYATQYQPMVRLAYVIVDTVTDAEHVVQDAFVALYRRYDAVEVPLAYLRTSVVNGSRKVLRRRRVMRRHRADPPSSSELDFNHVFDAVRRLPANERVLVALRYEQHLTDTQIAAVMSIPIGTVKSRLHRALTTLRKEIQ